ncbi:MAG: Ni/Fe hydrogenase subunit alpha [Blastocatellales bacterium]
MTTRRISVKNLARVEGEGSLQISLKDGRVTAVKLKIFEPPRFFEALLKGRDLTEAPDITARICGICPIAYQMSAVHAMEDALGISVGGQLRALRRLLYCGEWIESHALHIHMLNAPDYLGYPDAIRMARDHPEVVERGLKLKKIGNAIIELLGGRSVHPVNVRVGGFYTVPRKDELEQLVDPLEWARVAALETVRWTATLPYPDFEHDYEFVSLRHSLEYPMNEGRIVSSNGLDFSSERFEEVIDETQAPHSTALQSSIRGRNAYLVGPLARYALNYDRLTDDVREAAREAGLGQVCRNPFKGIIVRSLEVLYACEEALRLIRQYEAPARASIEFDPRPAKGMACTEAPRGTLYHSYVIDGNGKIVHANIVPPTSQNQIMIESDLWRYASVNAETKDDQLRGGCEQLIRCYDPCISCAAHFIRIDIDRENDG